MTLCGAYGRAVGLFSIRWFRPIGRSLLVLPLGLTSLRTWPLLRRCGSGSRMTQLA